MPIVPGQTGLDRSWMYSDAYSLGFVHLQVQIESLDYLIEGCLGRAVRIPAATCIVAYGAKTRRDVYPFGGSRKLALEIGVRKELREVFDTEKMRDRVDLKRGGDIF